MNISKQQEINSPKYWENYGYEYYGKIVSTHHFRSTYPILNWEFKSPLPLTPSNYIITIDNSIYLGKFGRTKNMFTRMKGYINRGGNRTQDRIQNSLYDIMFESFQKGKKVEIWVRNTQGEVGHEMVNEIKMQHFPDVEGFEKNCANKYKKEYGTFPKHYNPK